MKRYQVIIPLSILVVLLVAACTGTAGVPQTGQTAPTQAASAAPQTTEPAVQATGPATQATGPATQATGATNQTTEVATQATGATSQATDVATQTTGSATQTTGSATQATGSTTQAAGATPQATQSAANGTAPGYSPSASGTATSTGNTAGVPVTGQTTGNKPEASVGQLPVANPAEMQPFIGAAKDLPENVQKAVAAFLVSRLNAAPEKVLIVSALKRDFNNACLGLGQQDESCAETVTPGWLAIGTVNGSYYVVHTNVDGTNIRLETPLDNAGLTNFGRDFPIEGAASGQ